VKPLARINGISAMIADTKHLSAKERNKRMKRLQIELTPKRNEALRLLALSRNQAPRKLAEDLFDEQLKRSISSEWHAYDMGMLMLEGFMVREGMYFRREQRPRWIADHVDPDLDNEIPF
jgi:hypothetical protein